MMHVTDEQGERVELKAEPGKRLLINGRPGYRLYSQPDGSAVLETDTHRIVLSRSQYEQIHEQLKPLPPDRATQVQHTRTTPPAKQPAPTAQAQPENPEARRIPADVFDDGYRVPAGSLDDLYQA